MKNLTITLPTLSDQAAVDILDFLCTLYQTVEAHYADQIYRYYQTNKIVRSHPFVDSDEEPF